MTASADRGLRPERAAEIIVGPAGERGRRGSGYLVAPGRVLTAAHVVEGAADIRVRFEADRPGEMTADARVAWAHPGLDVAVLRVPEGDFGDVLPVSYGRLDERDVTARCTALGFPRFKLRTDVDGSRFRDAEHVHATCSVLSNRREGTLDLGVAPAPAPDPDPARDPWEGMSGAAVFSGGRLVGVVTRHHSGDGLGRIAASRVDRWSEGLTDPSELAALERLLAHDLHTSTLPSAVPPTGPELVRERYRSQLIDLAPEFLDERERELADLVSFCGARKPYLWLQGPPWVGKTALASWFTLHPPRGVVPVWCFVTSASRSDSDAYTAALIDQLAVVAGREPTTDGSPSVRDGERRLLLREAAERVTREGGTLLLVVDGLDEDQSLAPGGTGTSIASLLPERPPPGVRVLVTSRTAPGLPADVKGGHPLRKCRVVPLSATAASRHTQHEATHELRRALSGDRLQRELIGLLTAARGPLSLDDLRELTGEPGHELRQRLDSAFGRILRLGGDVLGAGGGGGPEAYGDALEPYVPARGHLFAHETLLTAAEEELGRDLGVHLDRLHAWADHYARRGWHADTPSYLLQPYRRLLAALGDTRRTTTLATDARRWDRLREATGGDAACVAEITAAQDTVRQAAPDDLGALAALAIAEDLVFRQGRSHPDLPAVYVRLGRGHQGIDQAHSVFHPLLRGPALTGVARAMAAAKDGRAVEVAEEALRTAHAMPAAVEYLDDPPFSLTATGTLVAVLAATGNGRKARRLLDKWASSVGDDWDGEDAERVAVLVEAFTTTVTAVPEPGDSAELLPRLERLAERITLLPLRFQALAQVAEAWAAGADAGRAAGLYDALVVLARQCADAGTAAGGMGDHGGGLGRGQRPWPGEFVPPADELALAARALYRMRPAAPENRDRVAEALAVLARTILARGDATRPNRSGTGQDLSATVLALVVEGRVDEARRLTEFPSRAASDDLGLMWQMVAEGLAREGRPVEAWTALENGWRHQDLDVYDRSGARVAALLVEAGAADRLEALLLGGATVWNPGVTEAVAALAGALAATDPARALRVLQRAQREQRKTAGGINTDESSAFASFAGALAGAGRSDEAERLVLRLDEPKAHAWGLSAVAVASAHHEPDRASRLAARALDAIAAVDDRTVRVNALVNVAQATARSGAADVAEEVVARLSAEDWDRRLGGYFSRAASAEAAAGLWSHDPRRAGRMFDDLLHGMRRRPRHRSQTVRDDAYLLATAGAHDPERGHQVLSVLWSEVVSGSPRPEQEDALLALLAGTTDPADGRRRMDRLLAECAREIPGFRPGTVDALVYAALGDLGTAREIARGRETEEGRAATLTALAAYVARAPHACLTTPMHAGDESCEVTARRLTALLFPQPSGPDSALARELLAEALTPDGWYHAAHVLAVIDPDALLPMRDVVFAYLGLDDRATTDA